MKTSTIQRERNRNARSFMKKSIKSLRSLQSRPEAENMINSVISAIDKAAQHRVIHKNKAARDKSKLMSFVKNLPA
nr:30S ribosomal protein S20 [candidate division Zixibacteria bacterium]